jgi:hypothetical protein
MTFTQRLVRPTFTAALAVTLAAAAPAPAFFPSSLTWSPPGAVPLAVAVLSAQANGGPAPYGLTQRPMPSGQDLEKLLPRKVGTFVREAFPAGTKPSDSEDVNIDYKAGADTVNVGFSIPGNPKDALEGIRTAKTETLIELKRLKRAAEIKTALESIGPPTSYYKVSDFIAWTRGGYFFYAKANSPAALDAFMKAFPF